MEGIPFPETLQAFSDNPFALVRKIPGIWPVDKPSGPSSNYIVIQSRKALGIRRTGHAGTLDPLASGLLIILAGNATRLFDRIQEFGKTYVAGFRLGIRTDSQDITGEVAEGFVPSVPLPVTREAVEAVLPRFTGRIMQTPPMHSALKKDGQPLYKLARQGKVVEREAREVCVESLELGEFDGVCGTLVMTVSSGFYVRTVIDDIGMVLGAGAVMTSLRRTAIGPFSVEGAITPEELLAMQEEKKKE